MTNMVSYLSNYREEVPAWLENYLHGEDISFKDLMSSRVAYYPGSRVDGGLIKIGNKSHSVHSFLYVDYGVRKKELENEISTILGYHQIGQIEWTEADIMPKGQYPINVNKKPIFFEPNTFVIDEKPYCFSAIMERNEDREEIGAKHFVVTFLFADGIATYYQLFVREYSKAPWLFCLQDHGFGGNYDSFGRGGILDEIIRKNNCKPTFVICGSGTRIWNGYEKVKDVLTISDEHHDRDLYKIIEG